MLSDAVSRALDDAIVERIMTPLAEGDPSSLTSQRLVLLAPETSHGVVVLSNENPIKWCGGASVVVEVAACREG